jgi:flagellar biogenesis protein FliO
MLDNLTGIKKKIIAPLAIVALGGGLLVFSSTRSQTRAMESENSISDPCQPSTISDSKINSLFADDSNLSIKSGYNTSGGELYIKTILSVCLVIILGIAGVYISKKLLPKLTNLPGKEIHIIETVHLGPRRAIHLLEVGKRRFLIGSTNENISTLADLNPALMDLSAQEMDVNYEKINDRQSY